MTHTFAAVDLGASSGRVMVAGIATDVIDLAEVHRFANRPVRLRGTLHWDALALWSGVQDGLRIAGRAGPLSGIGVDSWAIDYGLLDADGALLGNPVHYRDGRTDGVAESVDEVVPAAELYATTGVQRLPFTTIYQLVAEREGWAARNASALLLIADLFGYWLTGERGGELTNASTTGLLDVRSRQWSTVLGDRLGIRTELLPKLREPGSVVGTLLPDLAADCGLDEVPVYAVGSHDTASAVLGVPAASPEFAYISCGTWSLVGVELDEPVTTEAARAANFSNELGVDGTVRFLRNVMGLWLLQECLRIWQRAGQAVELDALMAAAAEVPGGRSVIDPDRPEFLPPGDMPARIQAECRRCGLPVPTTPPEITRCILDSLAQAYKRTVRDAAALSGSSVDVVHLVGGGAQNTLLCQLTADACELPVVAGPVEGAAYGNVLVQARAAGVLSGDRWRLRERLPAPLRTYHPGR